MAQQGSGLGKGPDGNDMTEQQHYDARSGAAKKAQTSFPVHPGMADRTSFSGAGPSSPGSGPDAGAPEPMDGGIPGPNRGKTLRRTPNPATARTSWDMKGAAPNMSPSQQTGKTLDTGIGGRVLGEAILSGSTKLPASTSEASGPAPAYTGRDPN